jgi:hypothetical protein
MTRIFDKGRGRMALPTTPSIPGVWANERAVERLGGEKRRADEALAERPWCHGAEADAIMAERALRRAGEIERVEEAGLRGGRVR